MTRILFLFTCCWALFVLPAYAQDASSAAPAAAQGDAVPLDQKNMKNDALMFWAAKVASSAMTFASDTYEENLERAQGYFSADEWTVFQKELVDSGVLTQALKNEEVVSATPCKVPEVVNESVAGGKYRWIVKMPMVITVRDNATAYSRKSDVMMVIERTEDKPDGVQIIKWQEDQKTE